MEYKKRRDSNAGVNLEKKFGAKKEIDLAEKRKKYLRKADTVFLFDPKVHMNLSGQEKAYLDKLEDYETNF
jgi:peptidyl-tRNA hydrolase